MKNIKLFLAEILLTLFSVFFNKKYLDKWLTNSAFGYIILVINQLIMLLAVSLSAIWEVSNLGAFLIL